MKPPATSAGAASAPASAGPDAGPGAPAATEDHPPLTAQAADVVGPSARAAGVAGPAPLAEPVLPEQSREDTDAAWGDYQEPADDHLYRDRPPHWADY